MDFPLFCIKALILIAGLYTLHIFIGVIIECERDNKNDHH